MTKQTLTLLSSYLILNVSIAYAENTSNKYNTYTRTPSQQNTLQTKNKIKEDKLTTEWRLRFAGVGSNDEQSQSKYIDFKLDLRSKYTLHHNLVLDIQPSLRLISGQSQTIDGADKLENKILLSQAAAHFTPFNFLRMSAGALNQRYIHNSLLVDDLAFPAARTLGQIKTDNIETGLAIETAIPTSTSLSTNTKELEPTPSLNSAEFVFKWSNKDSFLKSNLGYFIFNNLPSSVAQQSMLLGNTVSNFSDAKYSFVNKYEGFEASTEIQFQCNKYFDLISQLEYLKNTQVLDQDSSGYKVMLGTNLHLISNIDWAMKGSYFSIAPDAAVAFFNSRNYETNRIGYSAESTLAFKKENFKVGIQFSETEVMFNNPVQTKQKSLMIKMETFYANI